MDDHRLCFIFAMTLLQAGHLWVTSLSESLHRGRGAQHQRPTAQSTAANTQAVRLDSELVTVTTCNNMMVDMMEMLDGVTYIATTVIAHGLDRIFTEYNRMNHMDNVDTKTMSSTTGRVRIRLVVGGWWSGPALGGTRVRPHVSWFTLIRRGVGQLLSWC